MWWGMQTRAAKMTRGLKHLSCKERLQPWPWKSYTGLFSSAPETELLRSKESYSSCWDSTCVTHRLPMRDRAVAVSSPLYCSLGSRIRLALPSWLSGGSPVQACALTRTSAAELHCAPSYCLLLQTVLISSSPKMSCSQMFHWQM